MRVGNRHRVHRRRGVVRWVGTGAVCALALLVGAAAGVRGQQDPTPDPLAPLHAFVGHWDGRIDGSVGTGVAVREYEVVLGGRFVLMRHASVRPRQSLSPDGDHHREVSFFSYDGERETIMLREFYEEGVVNRYRCDLAADPLVVSCETEAIENGGGLSASLVLSMDGAHAFDESFELRSSGGDVILSFANRWTRRPSLDW